MAPQSLISSNVFKNDMELNEKIKSSTLHVLPPSKQDIEDINNQDKPIPAKPSNPLRYKTEMCRAYEENMTCRYVGHFLF